MSAAGNAGAAGFTLIEMLVILAILGLIAGLAFPAVDKALRDQDFAAAGVRLEYALHAARADAIRTGRAGRVAPLADAHGWSRAGRAERVPDDLAVVLPGAGVTFFADGSASGGAVTVSGDAGTRRWRVRAATGTIERRR